MGLLLAEPLELVRKALARGDLVRLELSELPLQPGGSRPGGGGALLCPLARERPDTDEILCLCLSRPRLPP